MRPEAPCLLRAAGLLLLAALLGGCPLRAPAPRPAPAQALFPPAQLGTPYDIVSAESLLTIAVYRAGALASAGHNHLIASHELSGTLYVPEQEVLRSSFEVRVPLASLSVDEPGLRAAEGSADFPTEVPQSAREGTRVHMLGAQLLDAEHYPQIVLRSVRLESAPHGPPGTLLAHVQATVRGADYPLSLTVRYERSADLLKVSAETELKQSDLGLKPYSAMLGALQVQDEMRVRLQLVARAAQPRPAP